VLVKLIQYGGSTLAAALQQAYPNLGERSLPCLSLLCPRLTRSVLPAVLRADVSCLPAAWASLCCGCSSVLHLCSALQYWAALHFCAGLCTAVQA
jgi:hypothetical protein